MNYYFLPELTLNCNNDVNRMPRNRNLVKEMDVNFKIITNRWFKRRQEQSESEEENKYPFTFMIDCLIEELNSIFQSKAVPNVFQARNLGPSV